MNQYAKIILEFIANVRNCFSNVYKSLFTVTSERLLHLWCDVQVQELGLASVYSTAGGVCPRGVM